MSRPSLRKVVLSELPCTMFNRRRVFPADRFEVIFKRVGMKNDKQVILVETVGERGEKFLPGTADRLRQVTSGASVETPDMAPPHLERKVATGWEYGSNLIGVSLDVLNETTTSRTTFEAAQHPEFHAVRTHSTREVV
ncbi:hypothetical protein FRB90_001290 [Tulasnella sp. 427]|nr:hypothetical protein FRB90_001290 [Tulasnella sp. 427]